MNAFPMRHYLSTRFIYGGIASIFVICVALLVISFVRKNETDVSCKDCNILIITMDPLRADSLRSMGGIQDNSPHIDALVDQGYSFTNAIAASSWTLPSAMSFMTSVYPLQHGIINKELVSSSEKTGLIPAALRETAPDLTPLVSLFRNRGYATAGFAGGAALDPSYGFSDGFDVYESPGDFEDIASSSAKALDFIRENRDNKFFVFLHGFDVHGQYMPKSGFDRRFVSPAYKGALTGSPSEQKELREQGVRLGSLYMTPEDSMFLRAIYDEKVSIMDTRIGAFLSAYKNLNIKRKTIIVFTSHHGDEFYEHGRIDHGMTLYDEVIRVPLVVVIPGITGGKKIHQQVRNIDILPTLLDITGIALPHKTAELIEGVSLAPLLLGKDMKLDALSETSYRYATHQIAIRSWDGWKVIYDREQQLKKVFYIEDDGGEVNNLYGGESNPRERDLINKLLQYINGSGNGRLRQGDE